jgi:hypothetical protein
MQTLTKPVNEIESFSEWCEVSAHKVMENLSWKGFNARERAELLNAYPLLKHAVPVYNEVMFRGELIKEAVFNGPLAKSFYNSNHDLSQLSRLWRNKPGRKFLVYDINGDFVAETTTKNEAENHLNKNRILFWRVF